MEKYAQQFKFCVLVYMPFTFCLFLHFLSHHQFIKQLLLKFVEIGKRKKTEQLKLLNQLLTYSVIQKTILDI